jgi:hypothetical protein
MVRPRESTTVKTETMAKIPIVIPRRDKIVRSLLEIRECTANATLSRTILPQITIDLIPRFMNCKIRILFGYGIGGISD